MNSKNILLSLASLAFSVPALAHGHHGGWGHHYGDCGHHGQSNTNQTIWCDANAVDYYECGNGYFCGFIDQQRLVGCVWTPGSQPTAPQYPTPNEGSLPQQPQAGQSGQQQPQAGQSGQQQPQAGQSGQQQPQAGQSGQQGSQQGQTVWCTTAASDHYDCGNGWSCGMEAGRGCVWPK